jgi:hypothetical protein
MKTKTTLMVLIAATVLASGCTGNSQESQPMDQEEATNTTLTASEWCQQNGNGESVRDGCTEQEDLLGNVSGQAYYAADNPEINCEDPQAYVCSE